MLYPLVTISGYNVIKDQDSADHHVHNKDIWKENESEIWCLHVNYF